MSSAPTNFDGIPVDDEARAISYAGLRSTASGTITIGSVVARLVIALTSSAVAIAAVHKE